MVLNSLLRRSGAPRGRDDAGGEAE